MKSIKELTNIGLNKDVLIVAGGNSVKDFQFDKLKKNMVLWGVNFQFPKKLKYGKKIKFDYQLYTDKIFSDLSEHMDFGETKLIGLKTIRPNDLNRISSKCKYYFDETIIPLERDSCYYSIYICRKIMNFRKIFVIGLDGYSRDNIHYWGDQFKLNGVDYKLHPNEISMIHKVQFVKMKKYYNELKDFENVYNCNYESEIIVFDYKLPWEVK